MKFRSGIEEKNIIVKCGADKYLPFALVFGFYVILFGTISPGGGFQGGVCVASAVLLLYLGYGYDVVKRVIRAEVLRVNEAIGASLYILLGLAGLVYGANFCTNIFSSSGEVGDIFSGGTITFMGYAVGFKVLCGIGFLLLMMLGLLAPGEGEAEGSIAAAPAGEGSAETVAAVSESGTEPSTPSEAVTGEGAAGKEAAGGQEAEKKMPKAEAAGPVTASGAETAGAKAPASPDPEQKNEKKEAEP